MVTPPRPPAPLSHVPVTSPAPLSHVPRVRAAEMRPPQPVLRRPPSERPCRGAGLSAFHPQVRRAALLCRRSSLPAVPRTCGCREHECPPHHGPRPLPSAGRRRRRRGEARRGGHAVHTRYRRRRSEPSRSEFRRATAQEGRPSRLTRAMSSVVTKTLDQQCLGLPRPDAAGAARLAGAS